MVFNPVGVGSRNKPPWLVCASQLPIWSMLLTLVGQLLMLERTHFLVLQPLGTMKPQQLHSCCISVYPLSSRARQGPACKNRRLTCTRRTPPTNTVHFQQKTKCRQAAARCVSVRPLRLDLRIWGMIARTAFRLSAGLSAPWTRETELDTSRLVRKRTS